MSARYIFRLDDITPTMNWGKFDSIMNLFHKHSIKPLLGIVPDNRDQTLNKAPPRPDFWDLMRQMHASDTVDIAQHGYQHILTPRSGTAILRPRARRAHVSEFAGDPYHDQVFKIREGNRILRERGLDTPYWMAPNHSFDHTTLRALCDIGFTAVTDGISLFPFTWHGLIFVPQQTWRPRWMPCGFQTICIHTNELTPDDIQRLRVFLRRPYTFSRFADAVSEYSEKPLHRVLDYSFKAIYHSTAVLTQAKAHPLVERRRSREQPSHAV